MHRNKKINKYDDTNAHKELAKYVDLFNATKFKKYLIEVQVHDNANLELMKYVRFPIRKQIIFFNISTKAAYIPA
jgi:hypothetical protein